MIRRTVHGVGELLITAGLFLMLFVVWQLWWTTLATNRANHRVATALSRQWGDGGAAGAGRTAAPPRIPTPAPGAAFGIVHVPRFGRDWDPEPIVQGVGVADLRHGVGHYPDTALPGQVGNYAMAGHRTTYGAPFNRIATLRPGDAVVVEVKAGWFVYRVSSTEIVTPSQVSVVAPVPGRPGETPTRRMLTMTSCHPEYSASERYVVHAVFGSFTPRSSGRPAALPAGS